VTAALEIEGLVTSFPAGGRRIPVVDGVDLRVEEGEVLALVGESGCGKSVTALSAMRLVPKPGRVDAGRVRIGGREILDLPVPAMRQVRGSEIAMIFQEPMTSLNPVMAAGDQVVEAIRLHERVSRREARERTLALFRRVGIPDPEERLDAFPHQLSGGLKQRVMIAMALSTRPRVLIADEPTTALDVTIQAQILELLRELQHELRSAILLITHDLGVVNELADRVVVMYGGRIVEEGTRHQVLGAPRHPYTKGLLASIPALAEPGRRLHEIPGVVPPPTEWPPGCRFAGRCPVVRPHCAERVPGATALGEGHRAFCFAVAEETPQP
jgi:oligopeptide/dipeptide ABC transporter ATP-binding protein